MDGTLIGTDWNIGLDVGQLNQGPSRQQIRTQGNIKNKRLKQATNKNARQQIRIQGSNRQQIRTQGSSRQQIESTYLAGWIFEPSKGSK